MWRKWLVFLNWQRWGVNFGILDVINPGISQKDNVFWKKRDPQHWWIQVNMKEPPRCKWIPSRFHSKCPSGFLTCSFRSVNFLQATLSRKKQNWHRKNAIGEEKKIHLATAAAVLSHGRLWDTQILIDDVMCFSKVNIYEKCGGNCCNFGRQHIRFLIHLRFSTCCIHTTFRLVCAVFFNAAFFFRFALCFDSILNSQIVGDYENIIP